MSRILDAKRDIDRIHSLEAQLATRERELAEAMAERDRAALVAADEANRADAAEARAAEAERQVEALDEENGRLWAAIFGVAKRPRRMRKYRNHTHKE